MSFCEWYLEEWFVCQSLNHLLYCFHLLSIYRDKCWDFIYLMGIFFKWINSVKSTITQGRQGSLSEFFTEGPKGWTVTLGASNPDIISSSFKTRPIFMNLPSVDTWAPI